MPRTMYDSTNPFDIPSTATLVAGYVDGLYAWSDAGWQRFRNASLVRITVLGTTLAADVADVENGDLTPAQGADWVRRKIDAGQFAVLYFSASRNGEIDAAMGAIGLDTHPGWGKWTADWTGQPPASLYGIADQYANPTFTGRHYDLSLVADYWPGVDPLPPPPPTYGPARGVEGWAGLAIKVEVEVPLFASELGLLASSVESLG